VRLVTGHPGGHWRKADRLVVGGARFNVCAGDARDGNALGESVGYDVRSSYRVAWVADWARGDRVPFGFVLGDDIRRSGISGWVISGRGVITG